MRRQKCDRNLPCGRCVKRGDADKCTREWPAGKYDPKVHRIYPRPEHKVEDSSPTSANGLSETSLHPSLRTPTSVASSPQKRQSVSDPSAQSADNGVTAIREPGTSLDFISWGQTKLSDYDLRSIELQKDLQIAPTAGTDWDPSNGFGGTGAAQVSFLQLLLPNPRQVFQVVEYHIKNILWYHGCFHAPSFYQELKDVCQAPSGLQIRNMDLRWAALLFSILAAAMTGAPESVRTTWGFNKDECAKLNRQWFKASLSCLNLSDYMWRHHIYSVEAITILTMSAHILGFGNTQNTLLGAALKIAQGLGLQRLAKEEDEELIDTSMLLPAQRQRIIQREVGRRLWGQLCVQDWFSVPFSEMYSIQRLHFSTAAPNNMDEQTLQILPADVPSLSRMGAFLATMARLIPEVHDAIVSSNTLFTKYEHVLEFDGKMRSLMTDQIPAMFDHREPRRPGWPEWIPWARRSLHLCYAHKIIMIHRPFLGRSFTEPAFEYSRQACLESSKVILKEAKQAHDEEGPSFWIDQAFMVAAGITLALDIFHRKDDEPELAEHRRLVDATINMLGKFENSMIGIRGVKLLSSLLTEQARMMANNTLATYRRQQQENGEPPQKRQKFDLPRFVENFAGNDSFTQSLKSAFRGPDPATELFEPGTNPAAGQFDDMPILTPAYEKFEQLFPPQGGFSNQFLFEDLLNFDV